MKKQLRIGIFTREPTGLYVHQMLSMQKAFEEHGHVVYAAPILLDEASMMSFVRLFKPGIIIETHRSRKQIPFLPKEIIHIAIVCDYTGESHDKYYANSEIIYCSFAKDVNAYAFAGNKKVVFLPFGFSPDIYQYKKRPYVSDLCFAGYITKPWDKSKQNSILAAFNEKSITYGEWLVQYWKATSPMPEDSFEIEFLKIGAEIILKDLGLDIAKSHDKDFDYEANLDSLIKVLGAKSRFEAETFFYGLCMERWRLVSRFELIKVMLKISTSLGIYGPDNWQMYNEFRPYYQTFIHDPRKLCEIYQETRINFHKSYSMHYRTLDVMGSGGFLFCLKLQSDDEFGGINNYFEPEKHYIPFTEEDVYDKAKYYLNHMDKAEKIASAASKVAHQGHTWYHRAADILKEIEKISV